MNFRISPTPSSGLKTVGSVAFELAKNTALVIPFIAHGLPAMADGFTREVNNSNTRQEVTCFALKLAKDPIINIASDGKKGTITQPLMPIITFIPNAGDTLKDLDDFCRTRNPYGRVGTNKVQSQTSFVHIEPEGETAATLFCLKPKLPPEAFPSFATTHTGDTVVMVAAKVVDSLPVDSLYSTTIARFNRKCSQTAKINPKIGKKPLFQVTEKNGKLVLFRGYTPPSSGSKY